MEWQWNVAQILAAMERLDRFIRLAGLDDELKMLDEAIARCRVDEKSALEYRVCRSIAFKLLGRGWRIHEIRRVTAWKSAGGPPKVEIEWIGSAVEPLFA